MDSKQSTLKINSHHLVKVFDDNLSTGSLKSGVADRPLQPRFFFENATAQFPVPIDEPTLSGEYPLCDKNWSFWLSPSNPNSHNLSDHEKCSVEGFNQVLRHQNTDIQNLE